MFADDNKLESDFKVKTNKTINDNFENDKRN